MADKKELTPRQNALIESLMGEAKGDIRTAMRIAGYSDSTSIREAIAPIRDEVVEAATLMIAMNAPKAAAGMIGVLTDPAALGAKNIVAAAKEVLDRSGVVKKEQNVGEGVIGAMFILPPKSATTE